MNLKEFLEVVAEVSMPPDDRVTVGRAARALVDAATAAERARVVRAIDEALNGSGAAEQASLCDITALVQGVAPGFAAAANALPVADFSEFSKPCADTHRGFAHPVHGKPLNRAPIAVCGVMFRPYEGSGGNAAWVSDCGRFVTSGNYLRSNYSASTDQKRVGSRFHTLESAMRAAVRAAAAAAERGEL